jgi:hypothetical protein
MVTDVRTAVNVKLRRHYELRTGRSGLAAMRSWHVPAPIAPDASLHHGWTI